MTASDQHPPDDELVSAVLDGEAGDDERARVEGDPVLRARLEELRSVRRAVAAAPPPPDPVARERALAAALQGWTEAADVPTAKPVPVPAPPAPIPLVGRRRSRAWIGAAAVAAVALGLVGGLVATRSDRSGSDSTDTGAAIAEADTGAEPDEAASDQTLAAATTEAAGGGTAGGADAATTTAGGATGAGGATTTAAAPAFGGASPPHFGEISSADELRAILSTTERSSGGSVAGPSPSTTPAASGCSLPGYEFVATATWQGVSAVVLVSDAPPAVAVVVRADGCQRLAEVALS
jgi:hypothetical protein